MKRMLTFICSTLLFIAILLTASVDNYILAANGDLIAGGNAKASGFFYVPSYNQDALVLGNGDRNWGFGGYADGGLQYWTQAKFYGTGDNNRGFRIYNANGGFVPFVVTGANTVGIGTAAPDPNARLQIQSVSTYGSIFAYGANGNNYIRAGNASGRNYFDVGGVSILTYDTSYSLNVGGNALIGGVVYGSSDAKLKKNILPISDALSKVLKLSGVSYEWNEVYETVKATPDGPEVVKKKIPDDKRHMGVIAQEIEKVLPEVVAENNEGIKGVAYSEIIPVLIEAIKEQQAQIEELKRMISSKK